jgi:hypothetical protein
MDSETIIRNYLARKEKTPLREEIEQVKSFCQIYDPYYVNIAVRFADEPIISSIAEALIRLCGFREEVPANLRWALSTRSRAKNKFSRKFLEMSDRLTELTSSHTDEQMEALTSFNVTTSPYYLWKLQTGKEMTIQEREVVDRLIFQYGLPLAQRAVKLLGFIPPEDEKSRIDIFQQWILNAVYKNYSGLDAIVKKNGGSESEFNWGLPEPEPFLLSLYYYAKTDKPLDSPGLSEADIELMQSKQFPFLRTLYLQAIFECEIDQLKELAFDSSVEEVIYTLSLVPLDKFSVDEIIKTHFAWRKDGSGLLDYILKKEETIYFCEDCQKYLRMGNHWWIPASEGEDGRCPSCHREVRRHGVRVNMDHIHEKYGSLMDLISGYDYSLANISAPDAYYCDKCGHYADLNEDYRRFYEMNHNEQLEIED